MNENKELNIDSIEPQIINLDPYGEGWIACIFPSDEINNVMNADEYQQFLDDLGE